MRFFLCWLLLLGCAPSPYLEPLPKDTEHHRARTADGWEVALVRYRAEGEAKALRRRPILLLHGISANARNMDLDARHSLARWFAAHGREAWTLSLRGTGLSDRSDKEAGRDAGFNLDTFARQDLPAAIAKVCEVSGAEQVDFVAHSMGGLVGYAYLASGGEGVAAMVAMGSPVRLDWGGPFDPALLIAAAAVQASWILPAATPPLLAGPAAKAMKGTPLESLMYNPENTSAETWGRMLATGTADVSAGVLLQLASMVKTGTFVSGDGQVDYVQRLAEVRVPVLVVAGKLDRLGVPPAVHAAYRHLGGPKAYFLVGLESGAKADYGHMDLVLGDRAADEVWPHLLRFLEDPHTVTGRLFP